MPEQLGAPAPFGAWLGPCFVIGGLHSAQLHLTGVHTRWAQSDRGQRGTVAVPATHNHRRHWPRKNDDEAVPSPWIHQVGIPHHGGDQIRSVHPQPRRTGSRHLGRVGFPQRVEALDVPTATSQCPSRTDLHAHGFAPPPGGTSARGSISLHCIAQHATPDERKTFPKPRRSAHAPMFSCGLVFWARFLDEAVPARFRPSLGLRRGEVGLHGAWVNDETPWAIVTLANSFADQGAPCSRSAVRGPATGGAFALAAPTCALGDCFLR